MKNYEKQLVKDLKEFISLVENQKVELGMYCTHNIPKPSELMSFKEKRFAHRIRKPDHKEIIIQFKLKL